MKEHPKAKDHLRLIRPMIITYQPSIPCVSTNCRPSLVEDFMHARIGIHPYFLHQSQTKRSWSVHKKI